MTRFDEEPERDSHGECRAEITRLSGEVARLEAVIADGGFSAWEVACSRADRLFLEGERLRGALEAIETEFVEWGDGDGNALSTRVTLERIASLLLPALATTPVPPGAQRRGEGKP